MSNPEGYHPSAEEALLKSEITDVFRDHAFEVGIAHNPDDPDSTTDVVLGGLLIDEDGYEFGVELWNWVDAFEGEKWEINVGYQKFELSTNGTKDFETTEPISQDELESIRYYLRETRWDGEYSYVLAETQKQSYLG